MSASCLPPPRRGEHYFPSELAALLGKHPNTLRRYEDWGFIGPVTRSENRYRRYGRRRALEALLAAIAQRGCFQEWRGRRLLMELRTSAVQGDYDKAEERLAAYRDLLAAAQRRVERANEILDRWRTGARGPRREPLGRKLAADFIGVSADTLRDWERNGLVRPARLPNMRRLYDADTLDRLVMIKVLRDGGHSLMGIIDQLTNRTGTEDLSFARDRWERTLGCLVEDTDSIESILGELRAMPPETAGCG